MLIYILVFINIKPRSGKSLSWQHVYRNAKKLIKNEINFNKNGQY